jgi:hypothetical protein
MQILRDLQERIDDLTLTSFAVVRTLAERDGNFADAYLAKREEYESGEMGRKMASNLAKANSTISKMRASLE